MEDLMLRRETPADYEAVEGLIRSAFYNWYVPGCSEHYLAHILRGHPDFIPELDLVAEAGGELVGSIMYTKSFLTDEDGAEKVILTFGPIAVRPDRQRRGIGRVLIEESLKKARELGYEAVVIVGDPDNYVSRGFVSAKRLGISLPDGSFPAAMLALELAPGALAGHRWRYRESPAYEFDPAAAEAFDAALPPLEKKKLPCQQSFWILSQAMLPAE